MEYIINMHLNLILFVYKPYDSYMFVFCIYWCVCVCCVVFQQTAIFEKFKFLASQIKKTIKMK